MLLHFFTPDALAPGVQDLDFAALWAAGYRGLIFDIDNTLVPHGAPADEASVALFARLRALGFQVWLLSNNGPDRIRRFNERIGAPFTDNARKPLPGACRRAVRAMGLARAQALVIGDQIFTDILCARLAGVDALMVRYVGYGSDPNPGKRRAVEERLLTIWGARRKTPKRKRLEACIHETTKALL